MEGERKGAAGLAVMKQISRATAWKWVEIILAVVAILIAPATGIALKVKKDPDWLLWWTAIGVTALGGTELLKRLKVTQRIDDNVEKLLALHSGEAGIGASLDRIEQWVIERGHAELIRSLEQRMNSRLWTLFQFDSWMTRLHHAIVNRTVVFTSPMLFRHFYRKMLETAQRGTHFVATSIPSVKYFWDERALAETGITSFLKGGGSMTRLFFTPRSIEDLTDEEASILLAQLDADVEVLIRPRPEGHTEQPLLFVVDRTYESVAWVVHEGSGGVPDKFEATVVGNDIHRYKELFATLAAGATKVELEQLAHRRGTLARKSRPPPAP